MIEQAADVPVVLDHPVRIDALASHALSFRGQAGVDMHARRVEPYEERLISRGGGVDEVERGV